MWWKTSAHVWTVSKWEAEDVCTVQPCVSEGWHVCVLVCVSVRARRRNRPAGSFSSVIMTLFPPSRFLDNYTVILKGSEQYLTKNLWTKRRKESELVLKIFLLNEIINTTERFEKKKILPASVHFAVLSQACCVMTAEKERKKAPVYNIPSVVSAEWW